MGGFENPRLTQCGNKAGDSVDEVQTYAGQIANENPQDSLVVIHLGGNDFSDILSSVVKEAFKSVIFGGFDEWFRKRVESKVDEIVTYIQHIIKTMRELGYRRFLVAELPVNPH